jgi:hypothetical protein
MGRSRRQDRPAGTGFVLPIVLLLGLVVLLLTLSLQALALQDRRRSDAAVREAQLDDGFASAAMVAVGLWRQGSGWPPQGWGHPAGRFALQAWQGRADGSQSLALQRLAAPGQPLRQRSFVLGRDGVLRRASE